MNTLPYDIYYSTNEDEKFLHAWITEKKNLQWFIVNTEEEISTFVKNWIGYSRFRAALTLSVDNTPRAMGVLFLMPYAKIIHHCAFQVIVDPLYQKQGWGTLMVDNLINLSKKYFKHEFMYAEIFSGCPLEKIIQRLNFTLFARLPEYALVDNTYLDRLSYQLFF